MKDKFAIIIPLVTAIIGAMTIYYTLNQIPEPLYDCKVEIKYIDGSKDTVNVVTYREAALNIDTKEGICFLFNYKQPIASNVRSFNMLEKKKINNSK